MGKKDYIKFADLINKHKDKLDIEIIKDIVNLFKEDNPRFDECKFLAYINICFQDG